MKIAMLTSHLPPYQSANTILPQILASNLKNDGHEVSFIVPRKAVKPTHRNFPYSLQAVDMTRVESSVFRKLKIDRLKIFMSVYPEIKSILKNVDVLHIHSNGFLHQIVAFTACRLGKPFILTHYGTEIWHYQKKHLAFLDPFIYMNKKAEYVTYYSKGLLEHSKKVGVNPRRAVPLYPPAAMDFRFHNSEERNRLKRELGIKAKNVIANVKRLHPLGGHKYLLEALPQVLLQHPDTHLYICGDGELRSELEKMATKLGIGDNVSFLGIVDNSVIWKYYALSDVYVLPSVLEALPTVAVEALACGTPVIITDTPGGKELAPLFPNDLEVVPKENPEALAKSIIERLSNKTRTSQETAATVDRLFRTDKVYQKYLDLYLASFNEGMHRETV